jgi:hypothetical protein
MLAIKHGLIEFLAVIYKGIIRLKIKEKYEDFAI